MTEILNISHHSFQSTHVTHESRVSLHFWTEKKRIFFLRCYVI